MKLKPCPFCGASDPNDVFVHQQEEGSYVVCTNCEAWGPLPSHDSDAAEAWNIRVGEDES